MNEMTLFPLEYRPELIPRRGEIVAWALAMSVMLIWVGITAAGLQIPVFLLILATLLVLAATAISLSNWVDRKTVLRLEAEGVTFQNGLRRVRLGWGEVLRVQVYPSDWGDKVYVTGKGVFFSFRTLHEVSVQGKVRGQMGFAEGEKIKRLIVHYAGLRLSRREGEGTYYERQ